MKQPTTTSYSCSSSKDDVFLTESPQIKKIVGTTTTTSKTEDGNNVDQLKSSLLLQQETTTSKDHNRNATDEFVDQLTLSFPVAINIDDIAPSTCGSTLSCMSSSINAQSTTTAIERNKSIVTGGGGSSRLTIDEEDRISKILAQDDDENYKDSREVELDSLLTGLGYSIDNNEVDKDEKERGDPVLRRLAKQRTIQKQKQRIDQALCALLREPLPPVVRNDDASLQPSSCDAESVLTAPLTEEDIQDLIERAKKELAEDKLELADHASIRMLAQSIVDEESSKRTSG